MYAYSICNKRLGGHRVLALRDYSLDQIIDYIRDHSVTNVTDTEMGRR